MGGVVAGIDVVIFTVDDIQGVDDKVAHFECE